MTTIATAKDRLEGYLREHGVCFTTRRHPLAYRAQEVADSEHISGGSVAKPVIVVADGRTIMLVVPASCVVQTAKLAGTLAAAHAELATEQELVDLFPDCEIGALPPFGNLYGLDVYVDRHMAENPRIEFRAGTHNESMGMAYADFARLVKPTIIDCARHR